MPEKAYLYGIPYSYYEKYRIRRYGFHGTSHKFVSERALEILGNKDGKVINCHIGNGASICAIDGGKSVDTSMGLTPLAGIPMGTRSGDIDPAIIEFMAEKEGLSIKEITSKLNKASGYLGVSGISSDARDVEAAVNEGNKRAILTINLQAKRIADHIGAYYLKMGGVDMITFTAGLGENDVALRSNVIKRIEALGVKLDEES